MEFEVEIGNKSRLDTQTSPSSPSFRQSRLNRYLGAQGYRWFRRTGLNDWYVPRASSAQVDLEGRLQFWRKHYLGVPFRRLREARRRWRHERALRRGP